MFPHGLELNLSKKVSFRKATILGYYLKYLRMSFPVIFANALATTTTNRYLSCLMLLGNVSVLII